jgi:hypothetical protein
VPGVYKLPQGRDVTLERRSAGRARFGSGWVSFRYTVIKGV